MLNQGGHVSGKSGKCPENKYMPHVHPNVIRTHVRRKNIHATYMSHVSYHEFRNTGTARNGEYATYILNIFNM